MAGENTGCSGGEYMQRDWFWLACYLQHRHGLLLNIVGQRADPNTTVGLASCNVLIRMTQVQWLLFIPEKAAPPQMADAFIAPLGENMNPAALALGRELRREGLSVELGDGSFRLKKSFQTADKTARRIVILGEDELQSGILTVKDFASGTQTKVPRGELVAFLKG